MTSFNDILLLLASLLAAANCAANCTSKGEFSCFSCMGRDMENCESGLTCCQGACFKLEDIKHNVIVKGCVNTKEEDASMKVRELQVPLYWANKELVKGESYFCTGKDFCNSSPTLSSIILAITSALFAIILY
ncbi:unnamed protein product [Caenorhabditis bovis]|uniref:UPAR/Ly6 domain-containing protein n=1 Tax=Caenorhabditis bovis TaxID=2654633 RepID=A0A8S1E9E8_9PELO|nr:unnamed protein product [Caenorhabditis bovis]